MTAYYNENNPKMAQSLRELMDAKLIAPGFVDERSILDVKPAELEGFTQHHFFAGIGVWSYALRLAGWPDEHPVCTGSCPCQPFSTAGKGAGFNDERHLWPAWHWLISQFRPVVVFGEQVAGKDARAWLDVVSTDMEGEGYTIGSAATVACGFGAPHKRQRLYWVADDASKRQYWGQDSPRPTRRNSPEVSRTISQLANDASKQRPRKLQKQDSGPSSSCQGMSSGRRGNVDQLGNADGPGPQQRIQASEAPRHWSPLVPDGGPHGPSSTNGFWAGADWLGCTDGKYRPVESGTFPLADGAAERVGRLSGYGNAIVAQQAQAFIGAYLDVGKLV